MKFKNDSTSESISNDMSEFDENSRSRSRSPTRSYTHSSRIKDHDALSIYIGNLDYSATENDLKNAFTCCGDIIRVTIIKNMKTGHPKGAAFIEFMCREGVKAAIKMNGVQVNGRALTVTSKKPRPEKRLSRERLNLAKYERREATYFHCDRGHSSRSHYHSISAHESRRAHHSSHQLSYESHRNPRNDPYRRNKMYDPYPYIISRKGPNSYQLSTQYYHQFQKYDYEHHVRKYNSSRHSSSFTRR